MKDGLIRTERRASLRWTGKKPCREICGLCRARIGKTTDEREIEKKGDLPRAFMADCICIQTSRHALHCHSGQNRLEAPNQPWPFTTLLRGRVCTSWDSICVCMCVSPSENARAHARTHTHTHLFVCQCLWMQTSSLHCLSDLSSYRQLSQLLSHTSNSCLRYPPIFASCLSDAHHQSIHLLNTFSSQSSNPPIPPSTHFTPLSIAPCFHLSIPASAFTSCRVENFQYRTEVERFHI